MSETRQYLALAASMLRLGQLERAEELCRHALADDDPAAWLHLSEIRTQRGDAEGAADALRGACRAAPGEPNIQAAAGRAELGLGRVVPGVRCLRCALRRDPTHLPALRDLSRLAAILAEREPRGGDQGPVLRWTTESVSVILCSPDAHRSAEAAARWQPLLAGGPAEIIPVVDPPSLASGYMKGLARATGDVVIFSHDDVTLPTRDSVARMLRHLRTVDVLGLAGTTRLCAPNWVSAGWPYVRGQVVHAIDGGAWHSVSVFYPFHGLMGGIQALDGLLIAARRSVADALGFDAETFDDFHLYDLDFSFRAHLEGFRVAVAGDIPVVHASPGNYNDAWERAADAFMRKFAGCLAEPTQRTDTYLRADFHGQWAALRFCKALARLVPACPGT